MNTVPGKQASTGTISVEHTDTVSWLIFDHTGRHNAMSLQMWKELDAALDRISLRSETRVIVLRGAGHRAFMSGADIGGLEGARTNPQAYLDRLDELTRIRGKLASLPQPVVAMIYGYCLGGGLDIAMRADLRIAADTAQFGVPAALLGVAYPAESIERLCRLVGTGNANSILLDGERFDANVALRMGLVNRVVPAEELESYVADYVRKLSNNAPLSMLATKLAVASLGQNAPVDLTAQAKEAEWRCQTSEDSIEGRTAFLAKRSPVFIGR